MDMRAGGAALATTPDTPGAEAEINKTKHLQAELEAARGRAIMANARCAVALRDPGIPLETLAKATEEASLAAGRVTGLARMLRRSLPVLLLAFI